MDFSKQKGHGQDDETTNPYVTAYGLALQEMDESRKVREQIKKMRVNTNLLRTRCIREGRDTTQCNVLFDRSAKMLDEISTYRAGLNSWIQSEWRPGQGRYEYTDDESSEDSDSEGEDECGIWKQKPTFHTICSETACCHTAPKPLQRYHTCCQQPCGSIH